MGELFRESISEIKSEMIETVRGKGLLNAIVIRPAKGKSAWDVCLAMKEKGIIAKPTHEHIIRFTPPLIITKEQMEDAIDRISQTFAGLNS